MLVSSILTAVRSVLLDKVVTTVGIRNANCEVQDNGMPPPDSGIYFLAVHPNNWSNWLPTCAEAIAEEIGVTVTLTMRTTQFGRDRQGLAYAGSTLLPTPLLDMELITRRVISVLHYNHELVALANTYLPASTGNSLLYEALRWQTATTPTPQGPDWFHTTNPKDMQYGLSSEIVFNGIRSLTKLTDIPDLRWS